MSALETWTFRLYIAGATPASQRAVTNLAALCEELLKDRYAFEVVDIYQRPDLAREDDIFAVPTLVRTAPPPPVKVVGDLSLRERVIAGLDLGFAVV